MTFDSKYPQFLILDTDKSSSSTKHLPKLAILDHGDTSCKQNTKHAFKACDTATPLLDYKVIDQTLDKHVFCKTKTKAILSICITHDSPLIFVPNDNNI